MLIEALGNLVLVSTGSIVALMLVSLLVAGYIGYRMARRRIEILEVDGTPSPLTGNTADSILEPAFSFYKNAILGR